MDTKIQKNLTRLHVILITIVIGLGSLPAAAEWSQDPQENNPVCTVGEDQSLGGLISDGEGGRGLLPNGAVPTDRHPHNR